MTSPPTPTSPAHQTQQTIGLAQRDGRTFPRRPGTATPAVPANRDRGAAGPAIETLGLTKRYGARTVVDRLDINVPSGVIAAFVGPNGAGKTTTLRMLLGLVRPTSGDGRVLGADLSESTSYLPRVGALIESPAFYPELSAERNLAIQTTLAGLDPARIPAVLERAELDGRGGIHTRPTRWG
jgi:ABC-2 type transport system ATP-binding protein